MRIKKYKALEKSLKNREIYRPNFGDCRTTWFYCVWRRRRHHYDEFVNRACAVYGISLPVVVDILGVVKTSFYFSLPLPLRPRPNFELLMRQDKQWVRFIKSTMSVSVKFVWMSLDRPTRSIRLLQTDNVWRSSPGQRSILRRTKLINSKFTHDNVYT